MNKKFISQSDFQDEYIVCVDCGDEFCWTAGEQAYFTALLLSPPKRCKPCRDIRKSRLIVVSDKDGDHHG